MAISYDILVRPVVTEKSLKMLEEDKYTFYVIKNATKSQIKAAVEEIFKVKVLRVATLKVHGKLRRQGKTQGKTPDRKKAIITLKPGDRIELFEGL